MLDIKIDNKNENIEILRAVAIILVILVHLWHVLPYSSRAMWYFRYYFDGSIGVDLFFVISGFVITRTLVKAFDSDKNSKLSIFISFWIKRIYRLIPAAFFWLFIVIIYMSITGDLWDGNNLHLKVLIPVVAAFTNVLNYYSAYCWAHPADAFWNQPFFFGHYWSLSFEVQFYLFFSIIFTFMKKNILIVLLFLAISIQFFWFRPPFSYGIFFRIDGFCWGILLALLPLNNWHSLAIKKIINNKIIGFIICYILILTLPTISAFVQWHTPKTYGISIIALISAVIVFIATNNDKCLGTWKPYRKTMLYLGSRSYSIYITHLIMFIMINHAWGALFKNYNFSGFGKKMSNAGIVIFSLAAIFIVSEMTYRFIELKFRFKGRELADKYLSSYNNILVSTELLMHKISISNLTRIKH